MTDGPEVETPYFAGSLLACVRMVLVHFGRIDRSVTEEQLLEPWVPDNIPPEEAVPDNLASPNLLLAILQSYGLGCRLHSRAKLDHLEEARRRNRHVIAFLTAKAHVISPKDDSYGIVVTAVNPGRFGRKTFIFHDPRPSRGGAALQLPGKKFVEKWTAAGTPLAFNV
jgi:hypothetical protein